MSQAFDRQPSREARQGRQDDVPVDRGTAPSTGQSLQDEATLYLTRVPDLRGAGEVRDPSKVHIDGTYTLLIQATEQSVHFLREVMQNAALTNGKVDPAVLTGNVAPLLRTCPGWSYYARDPVLNDIETIGTLAWAMHDHVLVRRGKGENNTARPEDVQTLLDKELIPLWDTIAPGFRGVREVSDHLRDIATALLTLPPGKDRIEAYLEATRPPWDVPTGSQVLGYRLPTAISDISSSSSLHAPRRMLMQAKVLPAEARLQKILGLGQPTADVGTSREKSAPFRLRGQRPSAVDSQDLTRSPILRSWDVRGSTKWVLMTEQELRADYISRYKDRVQDSSVLEKRAESYIKQRSGRKIHPDRAHVLFTLAFAINLCTEVEVNRQMKSSFQDTTLPESSRGVGSALVRGGDGEVAIDYAVRSADLQRHREIAQGVLQAFQLLISDLSEHPYFYVEGRPNQSLSLRAIVMDLAEQGTSELYHLNGAIGGTTTGVMAAGSYALAELQRLSERPRDEGGFEGIIPEYFFCQPDPSLTLEEAFEKFPSIRKFYYDFRKAIDRGKPREFSLWEDKKFTVPYNGFGGILSLSSVIGDRPFSRIWEAFKNNKQVQDLVRNGDNLMPSQQLVSLARQLEPTNTPQGTPDKQEAWARAVILDRLVKDQLSREILPKGELVKFGNLLLKNTTSDNMRPLTPAEVRFLASVIREIWPGFHWQMERTRGTHVINYLRRLLGSSPVDESTLKESEIQPHTPGGVAYLSESERTVRVMWFSRPGFHKSSDWSYNTEMVTMDIEAIKTALRQYSESRGYMVEFGAAGLPVTRDNLTVRALSRYSIDFLGLPPGEDYFLQLFPREDILYEAATNLKNEMARRTPQERAKFFMLEISHEVALAGSTFSQRFSQMVYGLWLYSKELTESQKRK